MKKRYAQVGVGHRSMMYSTALAGPFADSSELVALSDNNEGRLRLRAQWLLERGMAVKTYGDNQFDQMVAETRPDVVVVTTKDSTHDDYICRAMELGCDVITEKPMTTDAEKCRRILDTPEAHRPPLRVTFNYRYSPPRTQVKDLLMSGIIGNVVSVDFHWLLDTQPRRRLLPPLAPQQGQLRRADGAQGHPPLRPGELVAVHRARDGLRHRRRATSTRPRPPTRYGLTRARRALPGLPGSRHAARSTWTCAPTASSRASTWTTSSTTATSATGASSAPTSTSRTPCTWP